MPLSNPNPLTSEHACLLLTLEVVVCETGCIVSTIRRGFQEDPWIRTVDLLASER